MVTAAAPAPTTATTLLDRPAQLGLTDEWRAPSYEARAAARPIPVAAYPAGVPRWVTFGGRRQRVVAIHDQPALDASFAPVPFGARRMQVELADGRVLTLVHDGGGWYS
jgi:hypothetical protein